MRICIFLKNSELSELLSLECLYYGADVKLFTEPSVDLEDCDFLFFDSSADVEALKCDCTKVEILYDGQGSQDAQHTLLRYPFALSDIKDILFKEYKKTNIKAFENEKRDILKNIIYIDEKNRQAQLYNIKMLLSDYELRILKRLCYTPSVTVRREELAALFEKTTDGNMVDVYICRLRKKFESATKEKVIYTIRGEGYMTNYCIKSRNK